MCYIMLTVSRPENETTGFSLSYLILLLLMVSFPVRLTYQLSVVTGTAAFEKLFAGLGEGPESGGEVVCTGQCHIVQ